MMEKRNFVTNARTPMNGASDIDDILSAGAQGFECPKRQMNVHEKKASAEDNKTDEDL